MDLIEWHGDGLHHRKYTSTAFVLSVRMALAWAAGWWEWRRRSLGPRLIWKWAAKVSGRLGQQVFAELYDLRSASASSSSQRARVEWLMQISSLGLTHHSTNAKVLCKWTNTVKMQAKALEAIFNHHPFFADDKCSERTNKSFKNLTLYRWADDARFRVKNEARRDLLCCQQLDDKAWNPHSVRGLVIRCRSTTRSTSLNPKMEYAN